MGEERTLRSRLARKILRKDSQLDEQRGLATKEDLKKTKREIERDVGNIIQRQSQPGRGHNVMRAVRMFRHGFANISKSMNTPQSPNRPKISQLPKGRTDMGIVTDVNAALEEMIDPRLRGRDISGRKVKK